MNFNEVLLRLASEGNLRDIPSDRCDSHLLDFSTNDYLGFGSRRLRQYLTADPGLLDLPMTSSASRLLAATQTEYGELEEMLSSLYGEGRSCLLFNSGYHANTGIVSAIADRSTLIIADKLVHASIIDGMILSRARFQRFRHNDFDELERMIEGAPCSVNRILVIVESVYSMDGDRADLERLIALKRKNSRVMLYVDEAHAFGVLGPKGLGLTMATSDPGAFDVVVGTFGKALASYGAFAVTSATIRQWLINSSRSLIFSTSISPLQCRWTRLMVEEMLKADAERERLHVMSKKLYRILTATRQAPTAESHIQGLITGDAVKAVEMSGKLRDEGFVVLPIRTPTVPAGTERLRFSLSASMTDEDLDKLSMALKKVSQ